MIFKIIHKTICDYYNVSLDYIFLSKRDVIIVNKRQLFHYLCTLYYFESLGQIGSYYSHKTKTKYTHATIINSIKKTKKRIEENSEFNQDFKNIIELLEQKNLINPGKELEENKKCVIDLINKSETKDDFLNSIKHIYNLFIEDEINIYNKSKNNKKDIIVKNKKKDILLKKDKITILFEIEEKRNPNNNDIYYGDENIFVYNNGNWKEL